MSRSYLILLFFISLLGLLLRLNNYNRTPSWNECKDEIHYTWTGLTWITTGIPKSWSYLSSYNNVSNVKFWGENWRLVNPMLEKPPLYSLMSGLTVIATGQKDLGKVRISTIRVLPVALSVLTIFLTGLLASQVFSPPIGILAALLYATVPTVVLSNRLSVTENLLTPLVLLVLLLLIDSGWCERKGSRRRGVPLIFGTSTDGKETRDRTRVTIWIGFLSGLILLTKQSGIALVITLAFFYLITKQYKNLLIYLVIAGGIGLIYPITGILIDRQLFFSLTAEARRIGIQGGLPMLIQTILARPLITTEKLFPDGSILLGYILLLTSPLWLFKSGSTKQDKLVMWKQFVFIIFPFFYLCYLAVTVTGAEAIGSGQAFWGWYLYPLFPFALILVAVFLVRTWQSLTSASSNLSNLTNWSNLPILLLIFLILLSSSTRFLFLNIPRQFHYRWQWLMLLIFGVLFGSFLLNRPKLRKIIFFSVFLFYVAINVFTDFHLPQQYPSLLQP